MGWIDIRRVGGIQEISKTYKGEKNIIGYSLDYYEPELNLVIEWDEEYHFKNDKLKEKDVIRQHKIIDELNCDFYRIRQKDMNLYKI
ncbi:MAG: hypothetical protein H8D94_00380 [Candidatus Pelagibacter sp.]|nr:hypothetical protein [Candidatus Pelagibacter sp.]